MSEPELFIPQLEDAGSGAPAVGRADADIDAGHAAGDPDVLDILDGGDVIDTPEVAARHGIDGEGVPVGQADRDADIANAGGNPDDIRIPPAVTVFPY